MKSNRQRREWRESRRDQLERRESACRAVLEYLDEGLSVVGCVSFDARYRTLAENGSDQGYGRPTYVFNPAQVCELSADVQLVLKAVAPTAKLDDWELWEVHTMQKVGAELLRRRIAPLSLYLGRIRGRPPKQTAPYAPKQTSVAVLPEPEIQETNLAIAA